MIMLIFALIAQTGVTPQTTSLQCGIDNLQGAWNIAFVPNSVLANEPPILNMIIISLQLLLIYGYLLSDLFTEANDPRLSIAEVVVKRLAWRRMRIKYKDVDEGVEIESRLVEAQAVFDAVEPSLSLTPASTTMILRYQGSFLHKIQSMTFDMCFGISQVVLNRWTYAHKLGEESNRMDFGQIVPPFLLSVPMLVAAEIYYGE